MTNFYFDIETIPIDLQSEPTPEDIEFYIEPKTQSREDIKPPTNYKDEVKIQAWIEEKWRKVDQQNKTAIQEAKEKSQELYQQALTKWQKTCLHWSTGKIVCISFAVDNSPVKSVYIGQNSIQTEKHLLSAFMSEVALAINANAPDHLRWVAFNGRDFDLPYLYSKVLINLGHKEAGLIPANESRYQTFKVYDPMCDMPLQRSFGKPTILGMDNMCKLYGIEASKGGMNGSDVLPMYKQAKYKLISEYCNNDVEMLRELTIRQGQG